MNHNEEVPGFGGRLGDMLPIGTMNNNNGGCSYAFVDYFPATGKTAKTLYFSLNSYGRI